MKPFVGHHGTVVTLSLRAPDKRLNVRILYVCVRILFIYYRRIDAPLWLNQFISCYRHRRSPGSSTTQCKAKLAPKTAISSPGDTVASTVARKYEENTKSGISCGRPCGRINGRMQYCSCRCGKFTVAAGSEFLDFYDPYAARMPGRMTSRKGFL